MKSVLLREDVFLYKKFEFRDTIDIMKLSIICFYLSLFVMKKYFLRSVLWLIGIMWTLAIQLQTAQAYEDWIYTWVDENWNEVKTVIFWWNDTFSWVQLSIKMEDQTWTWGWYYYYRWFNTPTTNSKRSWYNNPWEWIITRETWYQYGNTNWEIRNNLWWWSWDTYENWFKPTPTNFLERQWPCDSGYHVPSRWERNALAIAWCNLDDECNARYSDTQSWWVAWDLKKESWRNDKLIYISRPWLWTRFKDEFSMFDDHFWSSSPNPDNDYNAWGLYLTTYYVMVDDNFRDHDYRVRCLKNSIVAPTPQTFSISFLDDWVEIASWSVEDGETRSDTVPTPNEREWYEFDYRYADWTPDTEFNFDAPITADTILHAKWTLTGDIPNWIYTWLNGWDKTVIYKSGTYDIKLTIAWENLPETYNWWAMSPLDSYSTDDNAWWWWDDRWWDSWNERYKRQWPCEEWYHVPSAQEWSDLVIAWCSLDEDCSFDEDSYFDLEFLYDEDEIWWGTKFKSVFNITSSQYYFWSSSPIFTSEHNQAYVATIEEYSIIPTEEDNRWNDYGSIKTRCFKNYLSIPSQTFTVSFLDDWVEIASWVVIDGEMRSDTVPTPDEREWYEFDYRYADWTPDTEFNFDTPITSDTLLHAKWTLTGDIPNGIYNLDNWDITVIWNDDTRWNINLTLAWNSLEGEYYWWRNEPANNNWSTNPTNWVEHNNDWWWIGDNATNWYDDWNERYKRQWPCGQWYHVPSRWERNALVIAWCNIDTWCNASTDLQHASDWTASNKLIEIFKSWSWLWSKFKNIFKLGSYSKIWSSSPNSWSFENRSWYLQFDKNFVDPSVSTDREYSYIVRCVKNYIIPPQIFTLTFATGENNWDTSQVAIQQASGSVIELFTGTYIATKDGYNHIWWNTNPSATWGLETITLTGDTTVYAIFSKDLTATYTIWTWISEISNNSGVCTLYNIDVSCTVVSPLIVLSEWYGTWVWSNWINTVDQWENIVLISDDRYTATATATKYKITYNLHWWNIAWSNPEEYTVESWFTLINPYRDDYVFVWWSGTNLSEIKFTVTIATGTTWNLSYAANWEEDFNHNGEADSTEIKKIVEFLPWDHGILSWTTRYEILSWLTLSSIGYVEPTKTSNSWYMFSGWDKIIDINNPIIDDTTFTAIWWEDKNWNGINDAEETQYKVIVNYEYSRWWEASPSVSGMYISGIMFSFVSPSIQYYTADSWIVSWIGIEQNQTFTVIYKPNTDKNQNGIADEIDGYKPSWGWSSGGWWWGWGWSATKPDATNEEQKTTETQEQTTQNDNKTATWTNAKEPENNTQNSPEKSSEWQKNTSSNSDYSIEFQEAYEFAHKKWITTMPTIERANMNWKLTRIAMAKMLSQYAINILWQTPNTLHSIKFNDVSDEQNYQYNNWVTLAYQLGIMWQNMSWNNFRPSDEVTRAEFATALSRMLYKTSDWEFKSTSKYYIRHIEKLMKEWIITKADPNMKELRGYVMIMLMRSAK